MSRVRVVDANKSFTIATGWFSSNPRPSDDRLRTFYGNDAPTPQDREEVPEESPAQPTGTGKVAALDHVSLDIRDGETISIVGPSGCGKTTLLRVISGLESLDSGQILYDDEDVTEIAPKDRGIGIVFQSYALYPHMASRNNLAFFFRMHKRENEITERVKITSEILGVGFEELLDRKPKELSGGQRQRVAIGRCIIRDPRLFLFDEPLSSLDAKLRVKTRVEIKRLLARFKITAIYVTHDQVEAIALGDRIVVMRRGRIEQVGTYFEVYDHPVNQFVGTFVGIPTMNIIPARVEGPMFVTGAGDVPIPADFQPLVSHGQEVGLGIRPEHLTLTSNAAPSGDELTGIVEVIEPIPSERVQYIHVRLVARANSGLPAAETEIELTGTMPIGALVQRGETLAIKLEATRLHAFDRATELSVRPFAPPPLSPTHPSPTVDSPADGSPAA